MRRIAFQPSHIVYDLISGRSDGFCRNPVLVDFFGKENKQFGFQATMGIMGAIAIVMLAFASSLPKNAWLQLLNSRGAYAKTSVSCWRMTSGVLWR